MSAVNPASVVNPSGVMQIPPPSAIGPGAIINPGNATSSLPVGPGFGNNHNRSNEHYGKSGHAKVRKSTANSGQAVTATTLLRPTTTMANTLSLISSQLMLLKPLTVCLLGHKDSSIHSRCMVVTMLMLEVIRT